MLIRRFTHACLHLVDEGASILIDPGSYSTGVEDITGVTAILITYAHRDHLDPARVAQVVQHNHGAMIYADAGSAHVLAGDVHTAGLAVTTVEPGQRWDVGTSVDVFGGQHAIIHDDIPRIANVGYIIGGRLCHPGDSLVEPPGLVNILALPIAAPWMAFKEGVDYVRRVRPRIVIPIHEGVLASPPSAYPRLSGLLPSDTELLVIDDRQPCTV